MKDYLIIGHGIAGAILAQKLLKHKYDITVIDNPKTNHSSSVAGGLYNPVTGRKMIKSWLADEIFPTVEPTYIELEKQFKCSFLHPIGIYRPFISVEEQNDWQGKSADSTFSHFIKDITKEPSKDIRLHDLYGGIHLKQAGYVDVSQLILGSKKHLIELNSYVETNFEENELEIKHDCIIYNHVKFRKLIFCNGIKSLDSPLFNWVPLRPVKGEVLTGVMDKKIETVYNRGVFVIPKKENTVRVGSNYQNHFSDLEPTQEAKTEILTKMDKLIKEPIKIIDTIAGIRPATKDRRPIIGKHPKYEHIYMFNGFGSKGVSLIPYFSEDFVSHLTKQTVIHKEVDIIRYYKLYNED